MRAHEDIVQSDLALRRDGESARILAERLPGARFLRAGAHLRPHGLSGVELRSAEEKVRGVDSFLIEGGYIRAQTIYYHA